MKVNESGVDRAIRLVAGGALAGAGLLSIGGVLGLVLAALGGVLVVTGAVGFCPLYALLGIDTCSMSDGCAAKHGEA